MIFLPSQLNLFQFILIVYSLLNYSFASSSSSSSSSEQGTLIDIDKYKNITCIKNTNNLITEAQLLIFQTNQTENKSCFLELSNIIKSLCPYEQSILYNAYQINNDSTRCFDVDYYKAFYKSIIDFQINNNLFVLSSISIRNRYICYNNLLEDYLTDEELEKLIVPNNILNVYQSIIDSKTLGFIENYTNSFYYIREYFLRPISEWKDYFVYEDIDRNIKNNTYTKTIIDIKVDPSKLNSLILDFVSYIRSIFSYYKSSLISNLKYTKIIASSKRCSKYDLFPNDNNVNLNNSQKSDFISLVSSNKTHYSSQIDIYSTDNIYKFQDFNHSITDEMKTFLKEYIVKDYENVIFNQNNFSNGYNLSLLKDKFDLVKDFKIECKKYFPYYINLNLNTNHSLYRKVFNIINGDKPYNESLFPDEPYYPSRNDTIFNKIKDTNYTFNEIHSKLDGFSWSEIEIFFEKSDKIKLFKRLLFFPYNNNQLPIEIINLYNSVVEEYNSTDSKVNSSFPLCLKDINSISTCKFTEKLSDELRRLLPLRFYENFNKSLILHSKLSSAVYKNDVVPININITSDNIIGLMQLDSIDEYFIYENGTCYSSLFNESDCSELFKNELDSTKDMYFAYISVQNHKILLYFNNKTYENNVKFPEYSLKFGDIDICNIEDFSVSYPEYYYIKPDCRNDIEQKCSAFNLNVGFEIRIFQKEKLNLNPKCDVFNRNFSEKECFNFISTVLLSSFQYKISENLMNPYVILYENNNLIGSNNNKSVEYLDDKSLLNINNNSLLSEYNPIYQNGSLYINSINSKYDINNIFLYDKLSFNAYGPKLQKVYLQKMKEYHIDTSDLLVKSRFDNSINLSQFSISNNNTNLNKEFLESNEIRNKMSIVVLILICLYAY